jgi:hypothetical protein
MRLSLSAPLTTSLLLGTYDTWHFYRVRHPGESGPDLIWNLWAAYKFETRSRNGQHCGLKLPFHI